MIGLFITARHEATRLPGKMLAPVCGMPVLALVIERAKAASGIDRVVLCTTRRDSDDALVDLACSEGIEIHRGSTEDVLARYLGAAQAFGIENVVVADGDDLFCEPQMVTQVADCLSSGTADFVQIKGMPYGTFPYGMSTAALSTVCGIKDEQDTQGWGRYFTQTGLFRVTTLEAPEPWHHPEYRMTLDYEEDLEFVRIVYQRLYQPGRPVDLDDVFALLRSEPGISEINAWRQAEYQARFDRQYAHIKLKKEIP